MNWYCPQSTRHLDGQQGHKSSTGVSQGSFSAPHREGPLQMEPRAGAAAGATPGGCGGQPKTFPQDNATRQGMQLPYRVALSTPMRSGSCTEWEQRIGRGVAS